LDTDHINTQLSLINKLAKVRKLISESELNGSIHI